MALLGLVLLATSCGEDLQPRIDARKAEVSQLKKDLAEATDELETSVADLASARSQLEETKASDEHAVDRADEKRREVKELLSALALTMTAEASGDEASPSAGLACDHFRNIVNDIQKARLDDGQIRKKFGEVAGDAANASEVTVKAAGSGATVAATSGNRDLLFGAIVTLDQACAGIGL